MDFGTWAGFALASTILLVIPGPTVLLVMSYALSQGMRAAWPIAVGVALGDVTGLTLSMLGLGAVLATSATLFTALKIAGAAYLVWLGVQLWRASGTLRAEARAAGPGALRMVGHAWLVTALNPKGITFFVAFLPQFLDPAGSFWTQMLVIEATFVALSFVNIVGYSLLAAQAGGLASSPRAIRAFNRTGGAALVGAGVWTASRTA